MPAPSRAADGRLDARPVPAPAGPPPPPGTSALDLGPGADVLLAVPAGEVRALLVFFHGAGGTAADALGAVADLATARGVAVLATGSAAATWDLVAGGLGRDVAALDAALSWVFDRLPVQRVALGGFSDGASYALSLGVANGDLAEAVLAFSPGFVAAPGRYGRPRFWIGHGTEDRVLPVDRCGRRVAGELRTDGYDVTYEEFTGGHVITPDLVTTALGWWLAAGPG
ncbi:alpha/beta hydrolase [Modestobacter versicolor]|uniref:Phospholipase n=1 Tax=Modestobacter versicolor TaxID=429133 RepID=A0A323VA35_9ACTN|nr:phospholipase [Modestobacter versicolor]MBB3677692.1 phospholipase/carboxylesterase [Modestobacter versicolor]PZA21634.1 phospholipase [Modestobacter versicolor]